MGKRFIDTNIFNDSWFMELNKDVKLLYIYLFTNCDHAGIVEVNIKLVQFLLQIKDLPKCLKELDNRIVQFDKNKPNRYFLPKFITFQYPGFPKSNVRQQESALKILKENNIELDTYLSVEDTHEHVHDSVNEHEEGGVGGDKEKILLHWNNFAKQNNLTSIVKLSNKRLKGINARLKEKEFDLSRIFDKIKISQFLLGNNERKWKVDFDFIFCSTNNYLKILEGKYDGQGESTKRRKDYIVPGETTSELKSLYEGRT